MFCFCVNLRSIHTYLPRIALLIVGTFSVKIVIPNNKAVDVVVVVVVVVFVVKISCVVSQSLRMKS